ncbi:S8 family serine peptidase [Pontibacter chitinilyticus]|uniref:S8 family serine peptidase n=1 Tax=Pontibacter chitinilyticus TaxID=2674989 RepID=UPI00321BC098
MRWLPAEGKYEAVFGYNNPSKTDVTIPPENSTLSCAGAKVNGNDKTFKPGRVFSAFTVQYDCPELTWTVTGPSGKPRSVTANGSTTACTTGGNITPVISSPIKTNTKIGSELTILPGSGAINTDNVYQLETTGGIQYVFIRLIAVDNRTDALLTDLSSKGFRQAKVSGLQITGWLPVSELNNLNSLANLNLAMPVFTPLANGGAVTSQGDKAQRTDLTRTAFGVQGEGIKIGVLSDSYNARPNNEALRDVLQGDLPGVGNQLNPLPVQVLKDLPSRSGLGSDEGRAILQIIHDVAPKAALAFRTGFDGPIDLAQGIRELKAAGCNIIVDDITYSSDSYFQDGVVAQAVDEVVAQGVTYFSAAGNFGDRSYQGTYTPLVLPDGRNVHNFRGGDYKQRLFLPEGTYSLGMEWSSNTEQDLDFYLTDDNDNIIIGYNRKSTYPFEGMAFNVSAGGAVANIMVVNASTTVIDPSLVFKYIIFRGSAGIAEYRSGTATITGHANAAGAIAIGAVLYQNTPAYGVAPPTIASFSSRGGTPILRDATNGAVNITREKPDFTAPNGGNTTVPLGGQNIDGDSYPNFFGTSAAAPHAAAAAALLIGAAKKFEGTNLTPAAVRHLLRSTALDMGSPGQDNATGYGFLRPDVAISTFATPTPIAVCLTTPEGIVAGKPVVITGHYFKSGSSLYIGDTKITPATVSETQLQAVLPAITGNPAIRVYSPPISSSGKDGGYSNTLYLYPKTVITIKANNTSKRYGDSMPTFTATLTNAPAGLTKNDIRFTTLATDISDVGAYTITPSIIETDLTRPILANTDAYEFVYEPGTLLIEKIPVLVQANDVAITEGAPIQGFTYTYTFPTPINNTADRIQLIRDNLLREHLALQTNKVALVTESELLQLNAIQNRSFLISAAAEANSTRILNGTRIMNISSSLLNELASADINASRIINSTFLMNAAKIMNSSRIINGTRIINSTRVMNSNTVGENNNAQSIFILDATDEVLSNIYSINLITGYTLGAYLWSPASLLSNNVDVSYGPPGNFFVNPIGTGVKAVKPSLDCVQLSTRPGYYVANFSYNNPNAMTVGLPEGSDNNLIYAGKGSLCFVNNTRKPTVFKPGKNYAFSVEFDGSKLTWDLSSFQGTKKTSIASSASSTSSRCKVDRVITSTQCPTLSASTASNLAGSTGLGEQEIGVYPNPVENTLTIDLRGVADTEVSLLVYDVLGRVCLRQQQLTKNAANEISMEGLPSGLYLVQMTYGAVTKQTRIVKR